MAEKKLVFLIALVAGLGLCECADNQTAAPDLTAANQQCNTGYSSCNTSCATNIPATETDKTIYYAGCGINGSCVCVSNNSVYFVNEPSCASAQTNCNSTCPASKGSGKNSSETDNTDEDGRPGKGGHSGKHHHGHHGWHHGGHHGGHHGWWKHWWGNKNLRGLCWEDECYCLSRKH